MPNLSEMKNNTLSLDEFTVAICASWNKAIESVIETAQMVNRAEEELDRKQLKQLKQRLEQDRVMSGPTFSKLAKIASNPVLTAPENLSRLPHSYATLYELSQHDTAAVQKALEQGKIHAAIKHKEIADALPRRKPNRLVTHGSTDKIRVAIRFSANDGDIPEDLLRRLHDVLEEISNYTDVNQSGIDE